MVRRLKHFVEKQIPDAQEMIAIEQKIAEWKCDNHGATPIIVIDFAAFYRLMCRNPQAQLDILFAKHERLLNTTETVLRQFQNTGAQLIFFCGGPSRYRDSPGLTGIPRQQYLKSVEHILEMIRLEQNPQYIVQRLNNDIINNGSYLVSAITLAEKYGSVHKSFHNDCIRDMAVYASRHNAIAIISGTADLVLIKGQWSFWEVEKLDSKEFKILQIDKTKVRDFLDLTDDELALVGVLTGTHFPFGLITNFLKSLGNLKYSIKNVAQFISKNFRNKDLMLPKAIAQILSPNDTVKNAEIAENALRLFTNLTDSEPLVEDELSIVVKQITNSFIYEFLNDVAVQVQPLFLCNSHYKQFMTVALQIHRRQMGVVLQHKHTDQRRTIICFYESDIKDEIVNPVYPTIEVPPLLRLYQGATDDALLATKLKLLCWIASDQLDYTAIENIKNKKQYLCAVLTLVNMVENRFISTNEADFILYCLHSTDSKSMNSCKHPSSIAERPFELVFLYDKFYQFMMYSVNTVGLADLLECNLLDGIFFHKQYDKFIHMSGAEQDNLLKLYQNIGDYRVY